MIAAATAIQLQAPQAWHAQAISPYRACDLCTHGSTSAATGLRMCHHRAALTRGAPVTVELVRSRSGACGPEALHLHLPGM